eukprot:GGOE01054878.1.p1 GENE.GGOE01054878.1~~GGOE01054878.1.p1  ORF type:complete len:343 (-),score=59.85 GGOE01054878.1:238-1266(-)
MATMAPFTLVRRAPHWVFQAQHYIPRGKRYPKKKMTTLDLVDRILSKKVGNLGVTNDLYAVPRQAGSETIVKLVSKIMFPNVFGGESRLSKTNMKYHLGMLMFELKEVVEDQVMRALLHSLNDDSPGVVEECSRKAKEISMKFLATIPELREFLKLDSEASLRGDPAAKSEDEILLCYPGFQAIFIHRIAHEFYKLGVPLLPRMLSAYSHLRTSIDIHPGAQIGTAIFMDHGTGIVIGETSIIGRNVKLFHGVTLGALSYESAQSMACVKRHPTIEDDVTIYAGAVILGGNTVIGAKAVVGGSLWITSSVPPGFVASQCPKTLNMMPTRSAADPFESWDPCI